MSKLTLLLDADVICHTFAYINTQAFSFDGNTTLESLNPEKARNDCEGYCVGLMRQFNAADLKVVLSDRHVNFRKQLEPTYKGKRKPKPALWYEIRDFLESEDLPWEKVVYERLEGDDTLGLLATNEFLDRSLIVSIDKDMKTVPGLLFNPLKPEEGITKVSPEDANRFHMFQTLTGDTVDCYPGCRGIGPKNAELILGDLKDPIDLWDAVASAYEAKGFTEEDAIHQARLAFILRGNHYNKETNRIRLWQPPKDPG